MSVSHESNASKNAIRKSRFVNIRFMQDGTLVTRSYFPYMDDDKERMLRLIQWASAAKIELRIESGN